MIRRFLTFLLCLSLLLPCLPAHAQQTVAADITKETTFSGTGYDSFSFLHDKDIDTYRTAKGGASITLECGTGIGGLYLLFDLEYGAYTVTDNDTGRSFTAGTQQFLHEYLTFAATTSVTLDFSSGSVRLSEVFVLSPGAAPDFVQQWQAPLEGKTDILLLSTHGDDDQLFFAGLLPLYAAERQAAVQVVYLTDHRNLTNARTHEILNGLWAVGVTAYPVMGDFIDFRIDDLEESYAHFEANGTSREDLLSFVVEQLRRFKPQVVVGHDIKGEYGHGMHMVYTDCLIKALDIAPDATQFPTTARDHGTWDVPKTYLHLYEENKITVDYDQPLDAFDGMTAFQVTQELGYPCHRSQQYTWFTRWINGKDGEISKASQIKTYSPCDFGLYRSTVGPDEAGDDFLEDLTLYADQLPPEPPTEPPTEPVTEPVTEPTTLPTTEPALQPTTPPQQDPPQRATTLPFLLLGILLILLAILFPLALRPRRKRWTRTQSKKFF